MEKQEFSVRKFSDIVGTTGEAELKMLLESIDIPLRGLTVVRPVHSTVLARSHCFQITTPTETRYFTCNSEEDANNWVTGLKDIIYPNRDSERRIDTSLDVWIFEAKGLPGKKRYYCEIVLDKVLYGRTSSKFKADVLFWGEQFSFDDLPMVESLSLYVFRENESKKKKKDRSVFIGAVNVPLNSIQANCEVETWLSLRLSGVSPKPQPKNSSNKVDQPSIRVKVKFQTISILPISCYTDLCEYIKINYLLLCQELEAVINLKTKDELAKTLMKIFQATNQAKEFLADVIFAELSLQEDENLTFRGNTLATKSMDTYMKIVGSKYLNEILGEFVSNLYDLEQDVEVDPARLTSNNLCENQKNLLKLVETAWSRILNSCNIFPSELKQTLSFIKVRCENLGKDVSVKLISGSVFLRFLCPAILSPSLFNLTREYPNDKTSRCLTLIAKALQNLANFTRFGGKEAYMEGLNEFVERELPNMERFLDLISSKTDHSEHVLYERYIDIGRELAVISTLLTDNFPKLCEESRQKLAPLGHILSHINELFTSADQEVAQNENPAEKRSMVGHSNSLPRNAECGLFQSLPVDNTLEVLEKSCYDDAILSSTHDYVSGCSLIRNNPSKPKGYTIERTKGRSNDIKSHIFSSNQSKKKQESENKKYLLSYSGERSSSTTEQSTFIRSSSFHGRSCRDEQKLVLMPSKSYDSEEPFHSSTHDSCNDYGLKTAKSELRLRTKSDQNCQLDSNDRSDQLGSIFNKPSYTMKTSTSLNAIDDRAISTDLMTDGKKTIRRLPDMIHESLTWNDLSLQPNQPLYFSPATEPMTPLGNHQFKYGFGILSHEEHAVEEISIESQGFSNCTSRYNELPENEKLTRSVQLSDHSQRKQNWPSRSMELPCFRTSSSPINDTSVLDGERYTKVTCLDTRSCSSDDSDTKEPHLTDDQNMNLEYGSSQYMVLDEKDELASRKKIDKLSNNKEFPERNRIADKDYNQLAELRRKLKETEAKMKANEANFVKCRQNLECMVTMGRKKLEETEARMRKQKQDKDEQMKSIISRLVKVESELRKEQIEMQEIVQAKQKIIEVQEKRIKSLDSANRRLVAALKQLKMKHGQNAPSQSSLGVVDDVSNKSGNDDYQHA